MNATGKQVEPAPDEPITYEIVLQGHLAGRWARRFEGMTMTALPGEQTLLAGPIADQAALHGILARIRDLGLTLISVARGEKETKQGNC
jgi:hypothetical protein